MNDSKNWSFNSIRKNKGHTLYKDLIGAIEALKDEPGEWINRTADYEVAWYVDGDARVVIYPHKTSAGHHHFRCRIQGKDSRRAKEIQTKLYKMKPGCSFQTKFQEFVR